MKVLKEAEAVEYLGRLDQTLYAGVNQTPLEAGNRPPFSYLRSIIKIEVSYLGRFMRNDETRGMANSTVSSSGFPELPSLMVDVAKAYEELGSIQSNIGHAVFPLLHSLEMTEDLAGYEAGVERVVSDFEKDQEHIDLLKRLQGDPPLLNRDSVKFDSSTALSDERDKASCIFTDGNKPGLLFYETGAVCKKDTSPTKFVWKWQEGYLKYIDSSTTPLLIICGRTVSKGYSYGTGWETTKEADVFLKTFPNDFPDILDVLNPLTEAFRERFLSVDFTRLPDGSFHQFIKSSARMGPLLRHISGVEESAISVPPDRKKGWWRRG